MNTLKELGSALRRARERRRTNVRDLAAELGVSFSSLARMERGEQPIAFDLMNRWAKALDLRVDFSVVPSSTPDTGALSPAQAQVYGAVTDVLPRLTDRQARHLLAVLALVGEASE